jgi:hypothetical protein
LSVRKLAFGGGKCAPPSTEPDGTCRLSHPLALSPSRQHCHHLASSCLAALLTLPFLLCPPRPAYLHPPFAAFFICICFCRLSAYSPSPYSLTALPIVAARKPNHAATLTASPAAAAIAVPTPRQPVAFLNIALALSTTLALNTTLATALCRSLARCVLFDDERCRRVALKRCC